MRIAGKLAVVNEEDGLRAQRAIGATARFERVDLGDDRQLEALMSCEPRILVNNAGGGPNLQPAFPEADADRWTAALNLNLRAPMLAIQLALEPMCRAGGGSIVNVGSTAGLGYAVHPSPEYSAAKAALIRLTATLAPLRESHQVRVNCVVPDWVATERALRELAGREPDEPLVSLETLTNTVVELIEDDDVAGQAVLLPRGRPPEVLTS